MLTLTVALVPILAAHLAGPPPFIVDTAESSTVQGRLLSLGPNWAVTLAEPEFKVAAGQLVGLRRADRPRPAGPRDPMIVLANGDRIRGTVEGGDTRSLNFAPWPQEGAKASVWDVPLTALAAVWLTHVPVDSPINPGEYSWARDSRRRDAVLLRNGDVARGTVEGFSADPLVLHLKESSKPTTTSLPLALVSAIAFDPTLARVRKAKGPYARMTTTDGSRVSLASASADGTTLRGTTLFGAAIEVPLADVVALDVLQGKAVYLSDLKPKKASVEGYNGVAWPWSTDRTVKGNPLRLGEETFDKGLGTHARTTLTYELGGKYRRFEALVGLDPRTGRRGAVDVRVLVDGKAVHIDGLLGLTAGAAPKTLNVDVSRAKELGLIVDFGPGGDMQDDVNWCNARLIE